MIVAVVLLHLSALFGGDVAVTARFATLDACQRLLTTLQKFSVNHEVVEPCRPQ